MKQLYKIIINLPDDITVEKFHQDTKKDIEDILLDYYYQIYWECQDDISKYKIVNITDQIEVQVKKMKSNILNEYMENLKSPHKHKFLASLACYYSNAYEYIGI
jgi:hypothetical protein